MNISVNLRKILFLMTMFFGLTISGFSEPIDDQEITNAVQNHLVNNSSTPAYLIDVTTIDGMVTLSGDISNLLVKEQAAKIAMAIKGVRGVINQIDVLAPAMQDHEIEILVKQALVEDPATEAYEVDANVVDGRVSLSGRVNSFQERQLAAYVAKGVIGVKDINNNIEVDYTINRTDGEIEKEIRQTLNNDIRIDNAMIDVSVNDGKVSLSGVVGSLAEKYQAETNAWVAGVKEVNSDELRPKEWARDENLRKDKYVTRSDAQVVENQLDVIFGPDDPLE